MIMGLWQGLAAFFSNLMWKVKEEKYDKPEEEKKENELKELKQENKELTAANKILQKENTDLKEKLTEVLQECKHWHESFNNCSGKLEQIVKLRSKIEDTDNIYPEKEPQE